MALTGSSEPYGVLVVDDEENVLRSIVRLFSDEPFQTVIALSGGKALDILRKQEMAVILSDQRMPEMSGAEFLAKSRSLSPESVRIVLTGYADINAAIDAINKGGAHQYLAKPWDDQELLSAVRNAVELYRLKKENRSLTELVQKQNEELKRWSSELELYVQQQTIDLTRRNQDLNLANQRLGRNFDDLLKVVSNLIELRAQAVSGHSRNVSVLSAAMAEKAGLSQSEKDQIWIGARLHDIGKIGIPDIILLKAEKDLTADEHTQYRLHPVRGQAAVDPIDDLRNAGILIRHHHENYDGSGFPDGLSGEDIPLGARIIAMGDRFDRILLRLPLGCALDQMKSISGSQLDPALYACFKEALQENMPTFVPVESQEAELSPKDLLPGMVISRDLRSGTGLLLLSKGMILTERDVDLTRRSSHLDPAKAGVYVQVKKGRVVLDRV